jgi:hypothetical protein
MGMSGKLLRPRATGFDPRTISNLTGWYDAAGSTSYTESSGQVSQWNDKSGQGNHLTQTTANNRPTLFESLSDTQNATRAAINGRQTLFFDGVNDVLETSNTVTSGQSRTIFAVARRSANTGYGTLCCFGPIVNSVSNRWLCRYGNNDDKVVGGDSISTNQTISVLPAWDSAHIACWSQNSTTRNLTYLVNSTSYAVTGNPPVAMTSFAGLLVGCIQTAAPTNSRIQFMNGSVGELVIYNRELSSTERTTVFRGLANRWGITL